MVVADIVASLLPTQECERVNLPPKEETKVPLPEWVRQSPIMPWLRQEIGGEEIWSHQLLVLEALQRGENVAQLTGTNSGKTLPVQIYYLHRLMTEQNSTFLIAPPLTALNRDQLGRWQKAFETLKLPQEWFAKVDGTVPEAERFESIKQARLLFMTPHSLHGWFLNNIDDLGAQRILRYMRSVFIDEAHSYEEIMGANAAFLFRRVITLHEMINPKNPISWIAASGSLGSPKLFLKKLTDRDFTIIGAKQDGARKNSRSIFHVQAETAAENKNTCKDVVLRAVEKGVPGLIFLFIDSRDGVEQMAQDLKEKLGDKVVAFSSRYTKEGVAQNLDQRIRNGQVKVVVTTSALQAGLHIPNASLVVNSGIPLNINDFHQRLGRVGRGEYEAAMVLVGDSVGFRHFKQDGMNELESYVGTPPSAPPLFTDNQAIGYIHAQCLRAERKRLGLKQAFPQVVTWPKGFGAAMKYAAGDKQALPPELRPLWRFHSRSPNLEFPLLNMGSSRCLLMLSKKGAPKGNEIFLSDLSIDDAMRECPPGGTYWQAGKTYFVLGWDYKKSRFSQSAWHIRLTPSESRASTHGLLTQTVRGFLHSSGVIQGNYLCHPKGADHGFIGELNLRVVTKITGIFGRVSTPQGFRSFRVKYRDIDAEIETATENASDAASAKATPEDEKAKQSPYFARKLFKNTTGVVVYLPAKWFGAEARQVIAEELIRSDMNARGKDVHDITKIHTVGYNTTNVTVGVDREGAVSGQALAVFDNVQCSLRLTESMFKNFKSHLEDALLENREHLSDTHKEYLRNAIAWYDQLEPQPLPSPNDFMNGDHFAPTPQGHVFAFAVGSHVDRERDGVRTSMRVVGYDWIVDPISNEKSFAYKLQAPYTGYTGKYISGQFDSAGNFIAARDKEAEVNDAVALVPFSEQQVQAPLDHNRFTYCWVNMETLTETQPNIVKEPAAGVVGAVDATVG